MLAIERLRERMPGRVFRKCFYHRLGDERWKEIQASKFLFRQVEGKGIFKNAGWGEGLDEEELQKDLEKVRKGEYYVGFGQDIPLISDVFSLGLSYIVSKFTDKEYEVKEEDDIEDHLAIFTPERGIEEILTITMDISYNGRGGEIDMDSEIFKKGGIKEEGGSYIAEVERPAKGELMLWDFGKRGIIIDGPAVSLNYEFDSGRLKSWEGLLSTSVLEKAELRGRESYLKAISFGAEGYDGWLRSEKVPKGKRNVEVVDELVKEVLPKMEEKVWKYIEAVRKSGWEIKG